MRGQRSQGIEPQGDDGACPRQPLFSLIVTRRSFFLSSCFSLVAMVTDEGAHDLLAVGSWAAVVNDNKGCGGGFFLGLLVFFFGLI